MVCEHAVLFVCLFACLFVCQIVPVAPSTSVVRVRFSTEYSDKLLATYTQTHTHKRNKSETHKQNKGECVRR